MMRKTISAVFFVLILVFLTNLSVSTAQNVGIVDYTFNAQLQTATYLSKDVKYLFTLPDGKILASGLFNTYNRQPVGRLIRLNKDASLDTTFNNDLIATGLFSVTSLPGGKILLNGDFTLTNGTVYTKKIVRLNADGTVDSSFNYPYTGDIHEIQVDANNRVLVSGIIHVIENNVDVIKGLIRLNDTGTLDSSFKASNSYCSDRFTTQNNKILSYCPDLAAQQSRLFRLNEDGTTDATFPSVLIGNYQIVDLKTQTDNKILILSSQKIFRLNANGSVDPDFQITTNFSTGRPRKIFLQSDGRITVSYSIESPFGMRVIRLLPNGTSDPSFTPYNYLDDDNTSYTVQLDGGVLFGDHSLNSSSDRFIRLLPSGVIDTSFNPGGNGFQNINPGRIRAISVLADEKILIGGDFDKVNNIDRTKIARLNSDSTLDTTFQINTAATGDYFSEIRDVYHFAVQSDGKIIVSGNFYYFVSGMEKRNLVRLNQNGSIDPTFNLSIGVSDWFVGSGLGKNKPLQKSDGKILVGTTRSGTTDTMITPLQLTATGSKDTSFNPGIFNAANLVTIFNMALQPDGKILIAGKHVNSTPFSHSQRGFIARLNSDGSVDQSFQAAELVDQSIFAFTILPNGQILIVSGTDLQNKVSRLNSNGSNDSSFNTATGANGRINAISVLPDNRILVGGAFTTFNNQSRQNLALLNANGTLGASVGAVNRDVLCITLDNHGRVLLGGQFTSITSGGQNSNGSQNLSSIGNETQQVARTYLARLIVSSVTIKPAYFDFDGDGRADTSVFRNGAWYINRSQLGFTGVNWGLATDVLAPADFDGDGKTDVSVFRDGDWYWINSSNNQLNAIQFGAVGDIPIPADYDGDGKADISVFRPSAGTWYRLNSSNNQFVGSQFGANQDKPLIGDFDGDGKADLAVIRAANGNLFWYWQSSSNNQFNAVQFGLSTDIGTAADYDGDGKTDVSVFRPSNGSWYRLNSSQNNQFAGVQFGQPGDIPVPADYDGDGKTDIGVFRQGNWYRLNSANNSFYGEQFGVATDKPVPSVLIR